MPVYEIHCAWPREQAYAVDLVEDGGGVISRAVNHYDAAILDVMLPVKDGLQVCRELRAQGSRIPVLMLTARDSVHDRIAGLDSGADDYLSKPFSFGELLARLRALLRRGPQLFPTVITIGDLEIDTRGQRARRAGRLLTLTTKEYALLEFLVRNSGRVVGRQEIAEHVWEDTFDPFSNLIEVYINRLRRKVTNPPAYALFTQGVGYECAPHR